MVICGGGQKPFQWPPGLGGVGGQGRGGSLPDSVVRPEEGTPGLIQRFVPLDGGDEKLLQQLVQPAVQRLAGEGRETFQFLGAGRACLTEEEEEIGGLGGEVGFPLPKRLQVVIERPGEVGDPAFIKFGVKNLPGFHHGNDVVPGASHCGEGRKVRVLVAEKKAHLGEIVS